jgi:hypothetical protein
MGRRCLKRLEAHGSGLWACLAEWHHQEMSCASSSFIEFSSEQRATTCGTKPKAMSLKPECQRKPDEAAA